MYKAKLTPDPATRKDVWSVYKNNMLTEHRIYKDTQGYYVRTYGGRFFTLEHVLLYIQTIEENTP